MIPAIRLRQALVLALSGYGLLCLWSPETFRLLDHLDLAIHEAGHLLFAPLGEFVGFLGGTLLQLLLPLSFVWHFHRQRDPFAVHVVLWWVAQNLWNISVYVRDARSQTLPLLGGGEHDWAYLLGHLDLLKYDQVLGRSIYLTGVLLFTYAMLQAFFESGPRTATEGSSGRVIQSPRA